MSPYTTKHITRRDTLDAIAVALAAASDEQLEGTMFALYGEKRLENYSITPTYDGLDEDDRAWRKWGGP